MLIVGIVITPVAVFQFFGMHGVAPSAQASGERARLCLTTVRLRTRARRVLTASPRQWGRVD
jgi:hypothetical protein